MRRIGQAGSTILFFSDSAYALYGLHGVFEFLDVLFLPSGHHLFRLTYIVVQRNVVSCIFFSHSIGSRAIGIYMFSVHLLDKRRNS
jgi:hypothetical protein